MKRNKAMPWWGWLAWVLTIILGAVAYTYLPAQVISNANRMTPRLLVVLYEPAIMLGIILLWHVLWRIDPKKKNYESFWPSYRYIGGVIVVCISLVYLIVIGHAYSQYFASHSTQLVGRIPHSMDFIEYRKLESHTPARRATGYSNGSSHNYLSLDFTSKLYDEIGYYHTGTTMGSRNSCGFVFLR